MFVYPLAQINFSRVSPWLWDERFVTMQGVTQEFDRQQGKLFSFQGISEAHYSLPCPTSSSGNGSIWQTVFFGRDVLSFSRAVEEMMYFPSGEIKRHIPQPDRKRGLEWFPVKLLYVVCKISNFYSDSRSISLLKLITTAIQISLYP